MLSMLFSYMVGKDGVAPPEPIFIGNRVTVCPATIYGLFPHGTP